MGGHAAEDAMIDTVPNDSFTAGSSSQGIPLEQRLPLNPSPPGANDRSLAAMVDE